MSDRKDFYYRQKVTEAELDGAFDDLEAADRNLVADLGFTGVTSGLAVTEHNPTPNTTVDVSAGTAYDSSGQRIRVPSTQNVDVSVDFGGISTAVAGPGNAKIVSLFVRFTRSLSDPRIDGNSNTVYFERDESFSFYVKQGSEAVNGAEVPPALETGMLLLADIKRTQGDTTIANADISTTRREDAIVQTGSPQSLRVGTIKAAILALLGYYNAHATGSTDKHAATAITAAISALWADSSGIVATNVDAAIEEIIADLAATAGGGRVGASSTAATYLFGLAGATVQAQLNEIRALLDLGPKGRRVQTVTSVSSPFTMNPATVRKVNVNTSGGPVTLQLPNPASNPHVEFEVKDSVGTFGTNNCTLARNGAEKIEGVAANRVLSAPWGSYRIYTDGTDWFLS